MSQTIEPIDFTYRYRPDRPKPFFVPEDSEAASVYLRAGNALISRFYSACRRGHFHEDSPRPIVEISQSEALGQPVGDDGLPVQMPFAAFIGCSDARVPTELLFGQEFNDIFNIRVAGNVLADEGVGSLLYALRTFAPNPTFPERRTLRLVAVLGHRGCGAVRATVQTFQRGPAAAQVFGDPIGSIVARIAAPPLALAAELYEEKHGTGTANDSRHIKDLVELVVYLNAAWVAHEVAEWVADEGPETAARVGVVYGVADPTNWSVNALPPTPGDPAPPTFSAPPKNREELRALGREFLLRISQVEDAS